jgi:agmatine deiminase
MSDNTVIPASRGFRMPAEWEPHAGTWFSWPRAEGISFPGQYETVPPVYAELIRHLAQVEEVNINVWDAPMEAEIRTLLGEREVPLDRVHFHPFPAYEPWCRDHGPIFLVRDEGGQRTRAVVDWGYNAWGGKYPPFDLDDAIPQHVAHFRNLELFSPGMVLEGGSIDVNGRGLLLTTEACLLHPNRNPHLSKGRIDQYLQDYLGVRQILWLGDGIIGDDTDGHIDDLARFVNADTIVMVQEADPADANYEILKDNWRRLESLIRQKQLPLRMIALPMPGVVENEGERLPASYANFYMANGLVLVPTYRHANDAIALETLRELLPGQRVVGIDSTALIWGLGSFHCISQQEPASFPLLQP